jgi:hypothetical protein
MPLRTTAGSDDPRPTERDVLEEVARHQKELTR